MKKTLICLVLLLALASAAFAESAPASSADRFLSNLSDTWDSFLDMTKDAGDSVVQWADDSGVTDWARDRIGDVTDWANESGLVDWANGAMDDIAGWLRDSGVTDWAEGVANEVRAFIDENGPAVQAWLAEAGENVKDAWDTLVNAQSHTREEVQEAYETVRTSLAEAGLAEPDAAEAGE